MMTDRPIAGWNSFQCRRRRRRHVLRNERVGVVVRNNKEVIRITQFLGKGFGYVVANRRPSFVLVVQ